MNTNDERAERETIYECEHDCDWSGPISEMKPIDDLEDRVAVGELMAAGQCPKCGGLISVADEDVPDYTVEACLRIARERGMIWAEARRNAP